MRPYLTRAFGLAFGLAGMIACAPPDPNARAHKLDGRARNAADATLAEVERRSGLAGKPVGAPDVAYTLLRDDLVSSDGVEGVVTTHADALAACARGHRGAVVLVGDGPPRAFDRALAPLPELAACVAPLVADAPLEHAPWALAPAAAAPDPATLVITGPPDPAVVAAAIAAAGPHGELALVVALSASPADVTHTVALVAAAGPRAYALRVLE